MPFASRSNAWLPDRANRLKPKLFRASSASGGVRNPLPSWTVSPFSATADSKLVNTTSPFSSPWITGTSAGAVARISDRIIDCPAKVIVIGADCGHTAAPIAHTIANRTVRHDTLASNRSAFNVVFIRVALAFSSERSTYSRLGLVPTLPAGLRRLALPQYTRDTRIRSLFVILWVRLGRLDSNLLQQLGVVRQFHVAGRKLVEAQQVS